MTTRPWTSIPAAAVILSLLMLSGLSAAAVVELNPTTVEIQQGSIATIAFTLDAAPDGLAGYRMNISLSNPTYARITSVAHPSWAVINNTSGVPGSEIRISGIDLGKTVENGTSSLPLATITLHGLSAGTCTLVTSGSRFDADGGAISMADPVEATITITGSTSGGTTSGGSSGASSGGGSSSSFTGAIAAQNTPGITPTPTSTATMAVVSYAAPEEAGISSAVAAVGEIPSVGDAAQSTQESTGSGTGFPTSILIIGLGILILAGIGIFIFMKRRG